MPFIPTTTLTQGSSFNQIYNQVLGADSASVDITSISASYANLLLLVQNRSTEAVTAATWILRFNGDSGANYDFQYVQVNSTTVTGVVTTATTSVSFLLATGASAGASRFGSTAIYIPNYATTSQFKNMNIQSYTHGAGASDAFNRFGGGEWASASAVNRITCTPASGNFLAGSRFSLYGIA